MKRRVLIVLAVILLCAAVPVGCGVSRQLAHQRALAGVVTLCSIS